MGDYTKIDWDARVTGWARSEAKRDGARVDSLAELDALELDGSGRRSSHKPGWLSADGEQYSRFTIIR